MFWAFRISVRRLLLTPANLNLDKKKGKFPELGTVFKAAHVKAVMWYCTKRAIAYAKSTGVPLT